MKRLLLPVLLALFIFSCKKEEPVPPAQGAPIVPVLSENDTLMQGFEWWQSTLSYDMVWEQYSGGSQRYQVKPDTLTIDGHEYFKVKIHVFPCNGGDYEYPVDYFLRKDLNDNHVYWRSEYDTVETLLYDFNLEMGSVVQNDFTDINMVIDSISTIDYNGVEYPEYYGTVTLSNGLDVRVGLSPLYLCSAGLRGLGDRTFPAPDPDESHSRGGSAHKYGVNLATCTISY